MQELDEVEHRVYYFSRLLLGAEMNYSCIECHCLPLVFARQKLHHYFLAHPLNFFTGFKPLKYLLSNAAMSRHNFRWILQLNGFDIIVVTLRELRSQPYLIY